MGRMGRVIGRAISSFIKRIVRLLGVARHTGVGGECRKGTAGGKGVEGLSRQPNDLCCGGRARGAKTRCSWQAVIFSVYPIVNVPWRGVCDGGAMLN